MSLAVPRLLYWSDTEVGGQAQFYHCRARMRFLFISRPLLPGAGHGSILEWMRRPLCFPRGGLGVFETLLTTPAFGARITMDAVIVVYQKRRGEIVVFRGGVDTQNWA